MEGREGRPGEEDVSGTGGIREDCDVGGGREPDPGGKNGRGKEMHLARMQGGGMF